MMVGHALACECKKWWCGPHPSRGRNPHHHKQVKATPTKGVAFTLKEYCGS
ncbi:hypothetical protein BAURA63_02303, partial [Brevibacterium aurantiacum]